MSKEETKKKILIAFDLDNTIVKKSSFYSAIHMLPDEVILEYPEPMSNADWAAYMQKLFTRMKQENITLDALKSKIENIPLNQGFPELFEFLRTNNKTFECMVISGTNTLFIQWILCHYKVEDVFSYTFSNHALPDENCLVRVTQSHVHNCKNCDKSICKRTILDEFFEEHPRRKYSNIFFVGDGNNDWCPSTILQKDDILFPRKDFYLYNMLYLDNMYKKLRCKIFCWKTGFDIIKQLKRII